MSIRAFSYGGGVQSTAALVLAARREIDYHTFLFSNVGDDSENPRTPTYVREVAAPFAARHGIEVIELRRRKRGGETETLLERVTRAEHSITLPTWTPKGGKGLRSCTADFKIRVVLKWLKQHGATAHDPATVGLGISLDEMRRMRSDSGIPEEVLDYPLVRLRLRRQDCARLILSAGLPVPPKSSCWFCPLKRRSEWQRLKRTEPALFAQAANLERTLVERGKRLGYRAVWFTKVGRPLEEVIGDQMVMFDDDDACESGYCHT